MDFYSLRALWTRYYRGFSTDEGYGLGAFVSFFKHGALSSDGYGSVTILSGKRAPIGGYLIYFSQCLYNKESLGWVGQT